MTLKIRFIERQLISGFLFFLFFFFFEGEKNWNFITVKEPNQLVQ